MREKIKQYRVWCSYIRFSVCLGYYFWPRKLDFCMLWLPELVGLFWVSELLFLGSVQTWSLWLLGGSLRFCCRDVCAVEWRAGVLPAVVYRARRHTGLVQKD